MPKRVRFSRIKYFIARLICNEVTGAVAKFIYGSRMPFAGIRIFIPDHGVSNTSIAAIYWGIYESAERRFIAKYLRSDLPTIELGSSLGGVSSHIARVLKPGLEFFCVEANPQMIDTLQSNLKEHASHLKVETINAAIHYEGSTCQFLISDDHLVSAVEQNNARASEIKAVRLRDLSLLTDGCPFQLVCDIEGAETQLLDGDSDMLKHCQLLIIELHDNPALGARISTLVERLQSLPGFRVLDYYGPVYVFENRAMQRGETGLQLASQSS